MVTLWDLLRADELPRREPKRKGWREEVLSLLGADADSKTRHVEVCRPALMSRALDIFKGLLCILMVAFHVNMCLVAPALTMHGVGHAIGNLAAAWCYLGFVFAYGWSCWHAYVVNEKPDLTSRVARSAFMPLFGAICCSCAWCFVAFKIPLSADAVWGVMTFYYLWGNGPDFLLAFPIFLLILMPFRHILRNIFGIDARPTNLRLVAAVGAMIGAPLLLTFAVVPDCSGPSLRRYVQVFLNCEKRDPVGMANLPALPHAFYFNMGLLGAAAMARFQKKELLDREPDSEHEERDPVERALSASAQAVKQEAETAARRELLRMRLCAAVVVAPCLILLSIPVLSLWRYNYGNLAVETPWGAVVRGFSRGPSLLWLLGNVAGVGLVFGLAVLLAVLSERIGGPVLWLLEHGVEHFGANVLLYLVLTDLILAGLYHGTFPLTVADGASVTTFLLLATRFVHYLAASSRK
jgi:hypothetical protein